MFDDLHNYQIGLATAHISVFGILIDHLEASGAVDKSAIEKELRALVGSPALQGESPLHRAQALAFGGLLEWLQKKHPGVKHQWRPVVVGGIAHETRRSND